MRKRAAEMESRMTEELERLRKSIGGELVPYGAYEPQEHGRGRGARPRIPIRRSPRALEPLRAPASRCGWAAASRAGAR